jgi:FkbM family methyltransferase
MSFISYAQNFEDVMLWRALRHVGKGFYVDAGAGGPDAGSSTRAFYERGWHGVNLEPSREQHAALLLARPADINLQVVAGANATRVTFYDVAGGGSTLDEARARQASAAGANVVQRELEQQTLSALCAAHAGADIHFMKIDAAGSEQAALAGLDLGRWRPWVLVVANSGAASWAGQLAEARYELVYNDGMHNFYVAAEHPELRPAFAAAPSAADDFVLRPDHPYAYPLTEWRERVERLGAAVVAAETSAQEARDWAEARVREHEQRVRACEQSAGERERLITEASARADSAEQRLKDSVDHYEGTIHAIYHSSSWRITRPLRSINFRVQAMRVKMRGMGSRLRARVSRMRGAFAGALKGAVRRVVRAIMSRPAISYFVRSQIGRHPRLTNWLRVAVQRTQAAPASMETAADLDNLPSSARQVLDDLRRTMKSTRPQ